MSLAGIGGNITGIVGMGLTAGVAFKVIDMVGDQTKQVTRKAKRSRNKGMMMDDMYGYQPRKGNGKKRNDDIFGYGDMGF